MMLELLLAATVGFVVALGFAFAFTVMRSKKTSEVHVYSSVSEIRAVGELVVFKLITKEIVTAAEHWLGDMGKKYLTWLISTKKMALIFEFGIDFKFDLQSDEFEIHDQGDGNYHLKMPRCYYETYIRDISFYDEQSTRLLPWLVPDLVNKALGMGFDERDKNRLKEEARNQADLMANHMVEAMQSEVHKSARQTLIALARGFGAASVTVDFSDSKPMRGRLAIDESDATPIQATGEIKALPQDVSPSNH
jgi:hypothetical protein